MVSSRCLAPLYTGVTTATRGRAGEGEAVMRQKCLGPGAGRGLGVSTARVEPSGPGQKSRSSQAAAAATPQMMTAQRARLAPRAPKMDRKSDHRLAADRSREGALARASGRA